MLFLVVEFQNWISIFLQKNTEIWTKTLILPNKLKKKVYDLWEFDEFNQNSFSLEYVQSKNVVAPCEWTLDSNSQCKCGKNVDLFISTWSYIT